MKFTIKSEKPAEASTGCVILGVFEGQELSSAAAQFDRATRGLLSKLVKDGDIDGTSGKTLLVHYPDGAKCERVMIVGCGKESEFNEESYCKAVTSTARAANACGATDAISYLAGLKVNKRDGYWKIRALVENTEGVLFTPNGLKSKKSTHKKPLRRLGIHPGKTDSKQARKALADGTALAGGVELARTLGNLPGNICTPSYLACPGTQTGKNLEDNKNQRAGRSCHEKTWHGLAAISLARQH